MLFYSRIPTLDPNSTRGGKTKNRKSLRKIIAEIEKKKREELQSIFLEMEVFGRRRILKLLLDPLGWF